MKPPPVTAEFTITDKPRTGNRTLVGTWIWLKHFFSILSRQSTLQRRTRDWLAVALLFGAGLVVYGQTVELPANLPSGVYESNGILTNCTNPTTLTGCTATTLNQGASVTLAAGSQIVLGPGFTAAGNSSTSLVAYISPPDFSLSVSNPGQLVDCHYPGDLSGPPCGHSSGSVTATPAFGFSAPVTFSWANQAVWPSGLNATFGSNPVTPSGGNPVSASINLTTGSWTPGGTYTLAFVATSGGIQNVGSVTVTVIPPLWLTVDAPQFVPAGQPVNLTADVWGGAGRYTYLWQGPAGNGSNSTYSFTAPSGQQYVTPTLTVTDLSGQTANGFKPSSQPTIYIQQSPDFQLSSPSPSITLTAGTNGPVSETVTSLYGFNAAVSFSWIAPSGWPTGLTAPNFSSTTTTTSTTVSTTIATPAGTYALQFLATGGTVQHSGVVFVTVTAPQGFTTSVSPSSQTVVAGKNAVYTVGITDLNGFSGTVTLSASGLPSGVSWSYSPPWLTNSGASQLTLSVPSNLGQGTYPFTVTGTSSSPSYSASASASLAVTAPSGNMLSVTTSSLPGGSEGAQYSQTLAATGGSPAYTWSVNSGSLPPGLTLAPSGVLSGLPTTAGSYSFTVQVVDSGGDMAQSQNLSVTISAPATLSITTASLPNGIVNAAYSATVSATGGAGYYSWALINSPPSWLSIGSASGTLTGTPPSASNYSVTVQVIDSYGDVASQTFTITVNVAFKEYIRLGDRIIAIENE